jgi:glycosyltransferase involved in cell wall biosynthesis
LAGVRRTVSTRHGLVSPPYAFKKELQYAAASWLVDAIVAVCRKAEGHIREIPLIASRRVVTVYNGCAPARRTGSAGLFAANSGWRVVQVGRLNPPKDPGCLIDAAALASREIEGLEVVFVGDGRLRGEMENKTAQIGLGGIVRFAGEQSNIGDWLDQADQFVLASRSEGVPVSVLEALEAGLPVAASDVGGIAEVLPGGNLSALAPAGDSRQLADAILAAWRSRASGAERATAIRAHYEAAFTLEKMAAAYRRLYLG